MHVTSFFSGQGLRPLLFGLLVGATLQSYGQQDVPTNNVQADLAAQSDLQAAGVQDSGAAEAQPVIAEVSLPDAPLP